MSAAPASTGSSVLDEIAEVIGEEAAWRLARHFGGRRLFVPAELRPNHPIAVAIGAAAAARLVEHFREETLSVPKRVERQRRVHELARRGLTRQRIAEETDYSERQVYRLLAQRAEETRQFDLFEGGGDNDL